MEERDGRFSGSGSRSSIHRLGSRLPGPGQRRQEVVNRQSDMVDALPTRGQEAGQGTSGAGRLEQFDFGIPHREERDLDSLPRDNFAAR